MLKNLVQRLNGAVVQPALAPVRNILQTPAGILRAAAIVVGVVFLIVVVVAVIL